jgi:hypothetical protein
MPELTFYCWIVSGKGATHSSSQNHHLFIYFVFLYRLELFFIHYFDILKLKLMETQDQLTAVHAKCFLITCMDFRLIDDITHFMDKKGYNNNYDQFILEGSSLGLTQTKFPHWG